MDTSSLHLRLKQAFMAAILLGAVALFIIPPLMAPEYAVRQGEFDARILSSTSGMGMGGKPVLRIRAEDETGRIFWMGVPTTIIVAPETPIMIEAWCETEAFESCVARYRKLLVEGDS